MKNREESLRQVGDGKMERQIPRQRRDRGNVAKVMNEERMTSDSPNLM